MSDFTDYDELCAYTLSLGDADFIHQHVVDAHAAQTATADGKPIGIFFALVGLYLYLEKGFTGRDVQVAHMKLARKRGEWPTIDLPLERGDVTEHDVMVARPGDNRRDAIRRWCESVWQHYNGQSAKVETVLADADII